MKKLLFVRLILLIPLFNFCLFGQNSEINKVNLEVQELEKKIDNGIFSKYLIEDFCNIEGEGATSKIIFYYEEFKHEIILRIVYLKIGHEGWVHEFKYYFDVNSRIIKFLNVILNRPDNPSKKEVIYDGNSKLIFKSEDNIPYSPKKILNLFKSLNSIYSYHGRW
jgi:hypothetical protein